MSTKAEEFGINFDNENAKKLIENVQNLEHVGYQFETADASLFILMNKIIGVEPTF